MPVLSTAHKQGDLVHPELVCGDLDGDCDFYTPLLNWDYIPGVVGPHYIATADGVQCAGLAHTITRTDGVPHGWVPYLAVDDPDQACMTVKAVGGQVVQAPRDIGDAGRIAFAADPTGAVFGLWRGGPRLDTHIIGESGTICAAELVTPEPGTSVAFYETVFGYHPEPTDVGGTANGRLRANSDHLDLFFSPQTSSAPRDRSRWLIYLGVADLETAIEIALQRGATLIGPPHQGPPGRAAFLLDPHHDLFGLTERPATVSR